MIAADARTKRKISKMKWGFRQLDRSLKGKGQSVWTGPFCRAAGDKQVQFAIIERSKLFQNRCTRDFDAENIRVTNQC